MEEGTANPTGIGTANATANATTNDDGKCDSKCQSPKESFYTQCFRRFGAVHDIFMDASRPQIIGGVTIAYQMMTTNGQTGLTRGKWDSAKGKDSEVTAKPRQSYGVS